MSRPAKPSRSEEDPARGRFLIEKAVTAMGGAAVIDGIRSLEIRSRSVRAVPGRKDLDIRTRTWIVFPDRYRQDLDLPEGTASTIFSREGAYFSTRRQSVRLPDAERSALDASIMRNPVALMKSRTHPAFSVSWIRRDERAGGGCDLLRGSLYGNETTLCIETDRGLLRALEYRPRGESQESEPWRVAFDDFRTVGGLVYPFRSIGTRGGRREFEGRVQELVINAAADPRLFDVVLPLPAWLPDETAR